MAQRMNITAPTEMQEQVRRAYRIELVDPDTGETHVHTLNLSWPSDEAPERDGVTAMLEATRRLAKLAKRGKARDITPEMVADSDWDVQCVRETLTRVEVDTLTGYRVRR